MAILWSLAVSVTRVPAFSHPALQPHPPRTPHPLSPQPLFPIPPPPLSFSSPWDNRTGWLGVKHYHLTRSLLERKRRQKDWVSDMPGWNSDLRNLSGLDRDFSPQSHRGGTRCSLTSWQWGSPCLVSAKDMVGGAPSYHHKGFLLWSLSPPPPPPPHPARCCHLVSSPLAFVLVCACACMCVCMWGGGGGGTRAYICVRARAHASVCACERARACARACRSLYVSVSRAPARWYRNSSIIISPFVPSEGNHTGWLGVKH